MAEMTAMMQDTITALVEARKYNTVRDVMVTMNPADIAAVLEDVSPAVLPVVFRLLPKELAAETFVEMSSENEELLIRAFSDSELKAVVEELYADDAADIVEEMPANLVSRILQQADPAFRKTINEILKYPEDSAGSIMTTEYVDLHPDMTVTAAMAHIRRTGVDKETINTCYVTEKKGRRLVGAVSIRTLLLADEDATVGDIMKTNIVSVSTLEDQEEIAQLFSKYDLIAMPVVDGENRMVGIVTVDDAIDVMEEEVTEDIEVMAAITPTDKPYLQTSVWRIWASRIPWLLLMMVSATFTGLIISSFESALAVLPVLTAFIPMLMDTGGNSGSQTSVTIIRGISLGDIEFRDIFRVMWKEFRVSMLCGVCLAVCTSAKILLVDFLLLGNGTGNWPENFLVAAVVGVTLIVTVFAAKLIGCTLPLLAKKIGFDPAVMASPFITTIVDAVSLLVYFAVASAIMGSYM